MDFANLFSGAFSKLIATLFTYPYTTIKVNQQGKLKSKNVLHTIFFIYFAFGVKGFYKGIFSKLTYTIFNTAFMFFLYDKMKRSVRKLLVKRFSDKRE